MHQIVKQQWFLQGNAFKEHFFRTSTEVKGLQLKYQHKSETGLHQRRT